MVLIVFKGASHLLDFMRHVEQATRIPANVLQEPNLDHQMCILNDDPPDVLIEFIRFSSEYFKVTIDNDCSYHTLDDLIKKIDSLFIN
jgi:hypothetical protein